MNYLHQFCFGIYPYIALTIFLLGSIIRFEREQYSWKSDSTQVLHRGNLRVANILFHLGIIGIFGGHLVGLLTPSIVWKILGVSHSLKQMTAMIAGGVMGTMCLIGLSMLIHRRWSNRRLWIHTGLGDRILLVWLLLTLLLGLSTIFASAQHLDGEEMMKLVAWAQGIVTFRGDAASAIADCALIFKLHMFMGMTLFVIFPFSRLVHIWSGIGTLLYAIRPWQLVRRR